MANNLDTNPIIIDTFSAHITIRPKSRPINVTKVELISAADGDILTLEDGNDNPVIVIHQNAQLQAEKNFIPARFCPGLVFDFDEGQTGLGAGDTVKIYHS